jgi:hypothetical protein
MKTTMVGGKKERKKLKMKNKNKYITKYEWTCETNAQWSKKQRKKHH